MNTEFTFIAFSLIVGKYSWIFLFISVVITLFKPNFYAALYAYQMNDWIQSRKSFLRITRHRTHVILSSIYRCSVQMYFVMTAYKRTRIRTRSHASNEQKRVRWMGQPRLATRQTIHRIDWKETNIMRDRHRWIEWMSMCTEMNLRCFCSSTENVIKLNCFFFNYK